jgi:5-(carboxyamino)imidazole ribonucleotide synthase
MRVGVLGGGQLGRMLALAAYPLGMQVRVFDPAPDACAGQVAEHLCGSFDDEAALARFADGLDVVTTEWENVPADAARYLAAKLPFWPPVEALETAQDRLVEKTLFRDAGISTAPFVPVATKEALSLAIKQVGLPSVLKTRRLGYDGKGQFVLQTSEDEEPAWQALGSVPLILEGFVPFQRELSIIAARGTDGETRFYPLVENHHRDGILRLTLAPAPDLSSGLQQEAEAIATRVLDRLGYVGVLAIELFQQDGHLLANEMASRVHNSGHWTIEGAQTSQFENHMRAVAGLPLGPTDVNGNVAMVNLIGSTPPAADVLRIPYAHLHLYGKEPRTGRKVGHVTIVAPDAESRRDSVDQVLRLIGETL